MKKYILFAISVALISTFLTSALEASDGVEVRGQVTDLSVPVFTWNALNFPGFFYDVDENIGTEKITFSLSGIESTSAILNGDPDIDGNRGVTYSTTTQPRNFKFNQWGLYNVIGFLGEAYFVSYNSTVTQGMKDHSEPVAYLYDNSQDKNLMTNLQISKVLIDDNNEQVVTSSKPLKLKEGYMLHLKSVDANANTATLELTKDSKVIDSKVVVPSRHDATMSDKTYYYKADIGDTKGIIQIAVNFKNAFHASDQELATVDGIFQISDEPISIEPDQQYDKMIIRTVDGNTNTITMDNKDYRILLNKDKDIVLMQNIHIKTANQDTIDDANPLRYYIYKTITVEPETPDGGTSDTNSAMPRSDVSSREQKPSSAIVNEGL
jgi:S-layer protein (TIGR01567 family)